MFFISADPGINTMGVSVIDPTDGYKVVESILIKNARKFTDEEKVVEATYGSRVVKVLTIVAKFEELLEKYKIDTIVLEAPFYNALTPMAFGSLLEIINVIKYQVVLKRGLNFKLIEPLLVKKLFTNKGMVSKEAMKFFLKQKQEYGSIQLDLSVDEMSEHEVDAVAIGYVYYTSMIEQTKGT